ncbi:MAG: DNA-binding transcriptional MerR regulator [Paracoccaceae bacterium]|jgi:DNA-binding transcriptional MerR regulator
MGKSPDAFRTISEVADWLGIQAHVLRFWESKFAAVKPIKRAGGRRYYRPADMMLLGGIKKLLHDDGLTIKGVQKMLREQGVAPVSDLSPPIDESALSIEVEIEEISATVLQFQGNTSLDSIPEVEAAEDLEPEVVDETENAVEITPEPEQLPEPEQAAEPENPAESSTEPEAVEPEELAETAVLPPFLSRSSDADETAETAKPVPASPQPEIARAIVVDAPDPGPDDSQNYSPGTLGHLAGLDYLTAAQAKEIAPMAEELRAWLARADAA